MEPSLKRYLKLCITIIISILFISLIASNALAIGLELNDRGDKVREVQSLLKKVGYDISTDGIFGHNTKEIVKDFQVNNDLEVDGVVGDNTYNKLKKMAEDIKYEVKKGDTLYDIAKKLDTTIDSIRASNNLRGTTIRPGDILYIPKTGRGGGDENRIYANIVHEIQPGDALLSIARKYGVDVQTIKQANNLNSNTIRAGDNIVIPFEEKVKGGKFTLGKGSFIWPLQGRISSNFGWRNDPVTGAEEFHKGLDIAVSIGTEIRAAASGEVVKSGWMSGFGKTIVIDHGEGVETIYAHNSQNNVRVGQQVNTGQIIGRAGSTGRSTGSHLHFGVMVNDESVNPMKYLP